MGRAVDMAVSKLLPPKEPYLARTATRYGPVISDRSTYKPFYAPGGHGHGGGPPMAFHGAQLWGEADLDFPIGELQQVACNITAFDTDHYLEFEDPNWNILIPTGLGGIYEIWGFVRIQSTSGADINLYVTRNETATAIYHVLPVPNVTTAFTMCCSGFLELEEGDRLRLMAFNESDFDTLIKGTEFIPCVFGVALLGQPE